jgi:hypothetical protein
MSETLIERLRKRAEIRRQIPSRKSVQEGKPDRIADVLEEAATELELRGERAEQLKALVERACRALDDMYYKESSEYAAEIREALAKITGG